MLSGTLACYLIVSRCIEVEIAASADTVRAHKDSATVLYGRRRIFRAELDRMKAYSGIRMSVESCNSRLFYDFLGFSV